MDATSLQSLASYLYSAPEWLDVVSVVVEEQGRPSIEVPLDRLESYPMPSGAFRMTIHVRPPGTS